MNQEIENTPKSQPTIEELIKILEIDGEATYIDNVDVTWNFMNLLQNSNQMLTLLLTKLTLIPIIPDFTKEEVMAVTKMSEEQSRMVQSYNEQFIAIQNTVQQLFIQQFATNSILTNLINSAVDELPETDMTYLLNFINNKQTANLTGGQPVTNPHSFVKFIVYLFLILCLMSSSSSTDSIELTSTALIDPKKKSYSTIVVKSDLDQFTKELIALKNKQSDPTNVNNIITKYDAKMTQEMATFLGKIMSLYSTPEMGEQVLSKIVDEFNTEFRAFSRETEKTCIELMIEAKKNRIFDQFTDMDTIKETRDKIEKIEILVKETTDNNLEEIKKAAYGVIISTATLPLTQDWRTPVGYLAQLGTNIYEYLDDTKNELDEKELVLKEQKSMTDNIEETGIILSETERLEFENKIFVFSKLYCSMGYDLHINYANNTIQLVGAKVPHMEMVNLITTLEKNIKLQVTKTTPIDPNVKMTDDVKYTIMALVSLQQRLSILKEIADYLYNIVNFSSQIQLVKMNTYATPKTLEEFEQYLRDQLNELNKLLINLNKKFPLQEKNLDEKRKIIEEDIVLQAKEMDIKELVQNATSIARKRAADLKAKDNAEWWLASETMMISWRDMGLNYVSFFRKGLGMYTEEFTNLAAQGPLSLLKGILKFGNNVLYEILMSPVGWVLIMAGFFTITFMFGGISGTIRTFIVAGKKIVTITIGVVVTVFQVVKTPFGYIWCKLATLVVSDYGKYGKRNYNNFLKGMEQGEVYDPSVKYAEMNGGKRRKTRKHKNLKTKKNKNGKQKKRTKHRKSRFTKRHYTGQS